MSKKTQSWSSLVSPALILSPMSTETDLVTAYTEGNKNFAILFTRWMDGNEWSHPIVVSLAKGVCGGASWFHSSQISGIRQGKSQSPGPRQFIAIERLNRALFNYQKEKKLIPGTNSSNNYQKATPILTEEGECPDLGWFVSLFAGLTPLPSQYKTKGFTFTARNAAKFSQNYARLIRKLLVLRDLDLIEHLDMTLYQYYPARDVPRVTKMSRVLTSPETWTPQELETELVALTALSAALQGPATEQALTDQLL